MALGNPSFERPVVSLNTLHISDSTAISPFPLPAGQPAEAVPEAAQDPAAVPWQHVFARFLLPNSECCPFSQAAGTKATPPTAALTALQGHKSRPIADELC